MDASSNFPSQPKNHRIEDFPAYYDVYCWGNHSLGQLGLGGIEEEQICTPKTIRTLHNRQIKDISCGENHTVFLLKDKKVYSCGNNDVSQLGHNKSMKRPEQIDSFASYNIQQICSGFSHNVAVNDAGGLLTWGDNTQGQLGRALVEETSDIRPLPVTHLSSLRIVQVACGANHTIALSDDGQIFTWGSNSHGQLGVGMTGGHREAVQRVDCLCGIATRHVAAGAHCSFILTVSGAVFGWGKNVFGQLGIGDEKSRHYPTLCRTLRSQCVKFIACGQDHTAVLTKDGGVFTFGAGMYGQLGHGVAGNESLPRKVFELMGSTVTQLTCGRYHTLAYVSTARKLYAFGQSGNGQLGLGDTTKRLTPTLVKSPFVCQGSNAASFEEAPLAVHRIFAGGDQCFVMVSTPLGGICSVDFRDAVYSQQILTLSETIIAKYAEIPPDVDVDAFPEVERICSSPSCLSGSFLLKDDKHYHCSKHHHGVDLNSADETLSQLGNLPNKMLTNMILSCLKNRIVPHLGRRDSPPDLEALRLYLTIPMFWCFNDPKNYHTVICPFAHSIVKLAATPSKVLDLWWSKLKPSHFKKHVNIFKQVVMYILFEPQSDLPIDNAKRNYVKKICLRTCLDVLKKLNNVNEAHGQIIRYEHFYLPKLHEKVDLNADYTGWITRPGQSAWSFCDYPFAFDAQAKTMLLQTDAWMQMQVAVDEAPVNPMLVLYVNRNNIVSDTIAQLDKQGHCDFKKPLEVEFVGEDALDGGGVRKEFFMLLLREILSPDYGMFRYFEESRLVWFNEKSYEDDRMFSLIGLACGLAIYNANIIDLCFPLALYKKLLKRPVTLDDLKQLDPMAGRSLQDLLDYEEPDLEEVFCLAFELTYTTVYGEVIKVELKPHGSNINVNKENREEYVDLYIDYIFNKCAYDKFSAFYDGFYKVCGSGVLGLFHPQELQAMVVGNEEYDWEQLERNTEYKGKFHANHKTIKIFWEVFTELSLSNKKKFLLFLTGSDRIPIHGMKAVKMIIQPTGGGSDFLPVAHTCFNLLDLPKYDNKDVLREKLCMAIQHSEGFGIV